MRLHTSGTCRKTAIIALLLGLLPFYAAADPSPLSMNVIVDGSQALPSGVSDWVSARIDIVLQSGGRFTLWAGGAEYSGKEKIMEILAAMPLKGQNAASDLGVPLRAAAARYGSSGSPLGYAVLIGASAAEFAPLLEGPDAALVKYSRTEEFQGWQAVIVGLNIDAKVRRAATDWLARR
ncbi:MAG: hypothetical protein LBI06_04960 [Treponema sp.]|jgi:hypothetical protein|nr:hypothetical protein [Treponema sp.]